MDTHTFFLYLLTILLTARLMGEIAVWAKAPSVIGELAAGIILGPSLLGWLEPNEVLKLLTEIGRVSGIFSNEIYAGMVIVTTLTTLLSPFVMKWFYGRYGDRLQAAVHG